MKIYDVEREKGYISVMIASRIYNELDRQGIFVGELAERLGMPELELQGVLDGDEEMSMDLFVQISHALGFVWEISVRDTSPAPAGSG